MRLLVTGAAGFIGSNYVKRILDGSLGGINQVTVLDKLTYAGTKTNLPNFLTKDFEFIEGDICDQALVEDLLSRNDAVVNFAAESHVDRSIQSSKDFILTNVLGTQTLLEASRKKEEIIFVQISTDEVYGSIDFGSSTEIDPLLPNSPYSASKASADLLTRAYFRTYGLDVRVTRCSNNFGPNQFPEKLIPLFITNLIEGRKLPIYGNGFNVRDWLHVDDHCRGIHLVLTKGKAGEIYNIGGGAELSNIELTRQILKIMGRDESELVFVKDRLGHDLRYSIDHNKISRDLGYVPEIPFFQGLVDTIDWYRMNESWWKPLK
jgi:dTDP-glucose 4,6-dehydratase